MKRMPIVFGLAAVAASTTLPAATVSVSSFRGTVYGPGEATLAFTGVDADGADSMYVVLNVEGSSAEIVDWGYSTVDDLLAAWDNVAFENISEFV